MYRVKSNGLLKGLTDLVLCTCKKTKLLWQIPVELCLILRVYFTIESASFSRSSDRKGEFFVITQCNGISAFDTHRNRMGPIDIKRFTDKCLPGNSMCRFPETAIGTHRAVIAQDEEIVFGNLNFKEVDFLTMIPIRTLPLGNVIQQ